MLTSIAIFLLYAFQVLLLIFLFIIITIMLMGMFSVPWVPTPRKIGRKMFEMAELKPGETVVDFGCGEGSLLLTALKEFDAKGIGFELHPALRFAARIRAVLTGVSKNLTLHTGNMFKVDLPDADVIATYLFPEYQEKLEPLLKKHYPSGTRVVCRTFKYPTLPLVKKEQFGKETLYLYRLP